MLRHVTQVRLLAAHVQYRPGWIGSGRPHNLFTHSFGPRCLSAKPKINEAIAPVDKSLSSRVSFALATSDSKALGTHMLPQLFSTLHLSTFSEKEVRASFDSADVNRSGYLEENEVRDVICVMTTGRVCGSQIDERSKQIASALIHRLDYDKDKKLSWDDFYNGITEMAQQRDPRVWPYVGCMVMVGVSVGVVMPAMPLLATQLGVTQAQFGYIASVFGLAKLLSNVPAGVFVDQWGRRATLVTGCAVCGLGYLSIAFASSLDHMMLARFVMGAGASFTMAGATMAVSDISTSLNRARMMGPVMSGFSAGAAIGPAVGGALIGGVGIQSCFCIVSGMFLINALATRFLTSETHTQTSTPRSSLLTAVQSTFAQWGPLCRNAKLRQILLLNSAYWVALAGGTLTVLPLLLTGRFDLAPTEIGMVFAMQSLVSVLGTEPASRLADRLGPDRMLAPALGTMAVSLAALPMALDIWQATPSLALMALSGAMLSTAPTAAVANLATPANRAQSLALLRTAGDTGWLVGGVSVGLAAELFGADMGLQGASSFLLATSAWFAVRRVAS